MAMTITKSSIGLINSWLILRKLPLQINQKKRADAKSNVPILPLYMQFLEQKIDLTYFFVKVLSIATYIQDSENIIHLEND
jgi:hypothetical protein